MKNDVFNPRPNPSPTGGGALTARTCSSGQLRPLPPLEEGTGMGVETMISDDKPIIPHPPNIKERPMAEPNILLTRIDNRLIHGQVGMTWTNWLGANLVLVADDETAADPVQQNLMEMAIAGNVGARFFTLQKTIDVIHKAASHQKIFLVVRTPQNALALVKGGVPIKNINVGNLHYAEGKKQIAKVISVTEDDIQTFRELEALGIPCTAQGTPEDAKKPILSLID